MTRKQMEQIGIVVAVIVAALLLMWALGFFDKKSGYTEFASPWGPEWNASLVAGGMGGPEGVADDINDQYYSDLGPRVATTAPRVATTVPRVATTAPRVATTAPTTMPVRVIQTQAPPSVTQGMYAMTPAPFVTTMPVKVPMTTSMPLLFQATMGPKANAVMIPGK
jgi:hypothetical protein